MFSFDRNGYCFDGERKMLLSGEFHYFRVPEKDFAFRMKKWREAGGNMLATYIPWIVHEPEEGKVTGLDQIRRFFEAAAREKLLLMVRPGPYTYSELINDGLPDWLLEKYPEIKARDRSGTPFRRSSVSYLHPRFLEKAENFLSVIAPVIGEYTSEHGGPVVLCQADNELFGIHTWFGTLDYNRETYGFGQTEGRYPRWLQQHFSSVDALNERYGLTHQKWTDFGPADEPGTQLGKFLWDKDYTEFYLHCGGEYLRHLFDFMEKHGVHCHHCHNSANPNMNAMFRAVKQENPGIVVGSDHYYNLTQGWPQNNPTPQYFINVFYSLELLRLMGVPPTVMEFPFGSMSDWPPFMPEDFEACLMLHAATGMKGLNGYILTGGPNVPGTGVTTDYYDYHAPIGAANEIRPTFAVLERFHEFLEQHPDLMQSTPAADFQVAVPWDGAVKASLPNWLAPGLPGTMTPAELWRLVIRGVLTTSFAAGLQPQLTDLADADPAKVLILPCHGAMPAHDQELVIKFLQEGGRVIALPLLPAYDENYHPCTLLADFVGGSCGPMVPPVDHQVVLTLGPLKNVWCNEGSSNAVRVPEKAEILGRDDRSGRVMCFQTHCGRGEFVFFGSAWTHTTAAQAGSWRFLLEKLGATPYLANSNAYVFAVVRGEFLFLCNLSTCRQETTVTLSGKGKRFSRTLPPMKVEVISLKEL